MRKIDIMLAFIAAWKAKDIDGVLALMDEEIVWHFAAAIAPPVRGKVKARRFMEGMSTQIAEVRWRIFDHAESGERLFVEGVDYLHPTDLPPRHPPYAEVPESRDRKVLALREYFDLGVVNAQKAGEEAPQHVRALIAREAVG